MRAWNNRDATTSKQVPASMVVLGGGPVGSELAQAWSTLGTDGHPDRGRGAACSRARSPSPARKSRAALRETHGVDVRTGALAQAGRSGAGRRRDRVELDDGSGVEARRDPGRGRAPAPHRRSSGWRRSGSSRGAGGFLRDRRPAAGRRPRVALRDRRRQRPGPVHPHGQVPGLGRRREPARATRSRRSPKAIGSPRVTFTDPQVAAVGKTLAEARGGRDRRQGGRRPDRRHAGRQLPGQGAPAAPPGSSSTRRAGRSSGPPSPASRPPTSSTRRRSRWSARYRSPACATRSPPTRPAARSG